jgi:hypothetical protein
VPTSPATSTATGGNYISRYNPFVLLRSKHAQKRNGDRNNSKRPTAGQKAEII